MPTCYYITPFALPYLCLPVIVPPFHDPISLALLYLPMIIPTTIVLATCYHTDEVNSVIPVNVPRSLGDKIVFEELMAGTFYHHSVFCTQLMFCLSPYMQLDHLTDMDL